MLKYLVSFQLKLFYIDYIFPTALNSVTINTLVAPRTARKVADKHQQKVG